MFGRTARHEGRTPVVGPQSAALAWTYETDDTGLGARSPVVGTDGTLYVVDAAGLTALSPAGTLLWRFQPGGAVSVPALGSDGTIYVGSPVGLAALAPAGSVAWTYPSGATGGATVAPNGTVYAIGSGPAVYALLPDGTLQWRQEVPGVFGMPALGPAGILYVTGSREACNIEFCVSFGRIFALDPATGRSRVVYSNLATGVFTSPPVVGGDGTIYVGTDPDLSAAALFAIRPSGGRKWRRKVGGFIESPPALGADGTVYVAGGDGFVYAIRPNGRLAWRYETEGVGGPGQGSLGMTSSPVVGGDGTIYVGSQDGFVYAIDPSGTLKWRHQTTGGPGETSVIQTSPAIGGDGTIYLSGWIGDPQPKRYLLYAFGPAAGLAPRP
jgi:outer membrane protein assembly factor BamB